MRSLSVLLVWAAACGTDVRLGDATAVAPSGDAGFSDATVVDATDAGADDAAPPEASTDGRVDVPTPCSSTQLDCNGSALDGCETDATKTSAHCGACAHDCLGGGCVASQCQPVELAQAEGPDLVALDATHLFFGTVGHAGTTADPNELVLVGKDGATGSVFAAEQGAFRGLATDGALLFTSRVTATDTVIQRSNLDGSARTNVGSSLGTQGFGIAVDGSFVYLANGTRVDRFGKLGSGALPTVLTTLMSRAVAVTVDSVRIYVADAQAAAIRGLAVATGVTLWTSVVSGTPADVAVDGTHVYFAATDRVGRLARNGSGLETFAPGLVGAGSVALDASDVAWCTTTEIWIAPKAQPTSSRRLAFGFKGLGHVAMDPVAVYFTDRAGNRVYKVAR